jgi:hypothetical protein
MRRPWCSRPPLLTGMFNLGSREPVNAAEPGTGLLASAEAVSRHRGKGFALVGRVRLGSFEPQLRAQPPQRPNRDAPMMLDVRSVMVGLDGLMYASVAPLPQGPVDQAAAVQGKASTITAQSQGRPKTTTNLRGQGQAGVPQPEEPLVVIHGNGTGTGTGRALQVTGATEVRATQGFPFSAVGHMQSEKWGCSGALIGRYTVGTAGHCVYDRDSQQWSLYAFSPGRYLSPSGELVQPYGTYSPRTAMTTVSHMIIRSA